MKRTGVATVNGLVVLPSGGLVLRLLITKRAGTRRLEIAIPHGQEFGQALEDAYLLVDQASRAQGARAPAVRVEPDCDLDAPVDGPSIGLAALAGMVAVVSDRSVPDWLALTGALCPNDKVGAVSGMRKKLAAASDAGLSLVVGPAQQHTAAPTLRYMGFEECGAAVLFALSRKRRIS
jgi:ATP-dependent Lon protease